jgi:hypothetical protein
MLIVITGCVYDPPPKGDTRFIITNSSNNEIYCYASLDTNIKDITYLLEKKTDKAGKFIFPIEQIPSFTSKSIRGVAMWKDFINVNSKDSSISIFIFDKGVVEKQGWDQIIRNGKYLKRFRLKESDLVKMQWNIVFDGKE